MDYKVVRAHGVQEITTGGKPFTKRKFTVDPKKKPKHIDFIDDQNTRNLGIYELKADQLTVAQFAEKEKMTSDRPTKFDNGGMIIAVYERVKE
jgi:uncharacterized protein (TIGR03067 family)